MTPANNSKELVKTLVDVLSLGIHHDKLEDAEAVLACTRNLRPKLTELDTFEAWIAMRRRLWPEALQILRNLDVTSPDFALGKALMALCQCVTGDAAWRGTAQDVMENSQNAEARNLVRLLVDPTTAEEEPPPAPAPSQPPPDYGANIYLRA